MKIISWNVNGIRSAIKKGFWKFVEKYDADIICLQETKAQPVQLIDFALPKHYEAFWNWPPKKSGYSGTAIYTKTKPLKVTYGIGIEKHDQEGRVITAEYKDFFLVNVYVPNSKRDLSRLKYRAEEWDVDFLNYLKKLEKRKPVVLCGDLNVAHTENDLTNPASNRKSHGFTDEERAGFTNIIKSRFIDSFREFKKEKGFYTWWSPFNHCRSRNIGWRIDYFIISPGLRKRLKASYMLPEVLGSDHCPVVLELAV